jgi:MFS family permease
LRPVKPDTSSPSVTKGQKWLNRNILALGLTSFFSDFGHEMATSILPAFLVSIGGSPALLGLIEGVSDASTSLMKLVSGWYSDHIGKRKPFASVGYFLTAVGVGAFSLAFSWPQVLLSRVIAWMGRGTREPARDALLADSTNSRYYGRVFGFHRMMDTLGAIIGPALALVFIKLMPLRPIFLIALIPSILAFVTIVLLVREKAGDKQESLHLFASIKNLPPNFRSFLIAVGIFGLGNFADTMLILRATELMTPTKGAAVATGLAILLYTFHNISYAAFSFPGGILADKIGKRTLLAIGYFVTGVVSLGFILNVASLSYLVPLFLLAGVAIAITDALERAVAADLLPENLRGTGYGTLATVNGIGDFASSAIVGLLWTSVSPLAGFGYGAVMTIIGASTLIAISRRQNIQI